MSIEEEYNDSEYSYDTQSYYKQEYMEFSDDSNSSIRQRYSSSEFKKGEKGHHIVKRIGKTGENTFFEFYETAIFPKTTIRNAISGERYKGYLVGTNDENLFFKVMNSSAEMKNKDPFVLFYDNPEQWERHNNQTCPITVKSKWDMKFKSEMKKRKNPVFITALQNVEKLENNFTSE
jgi:hypothetical protein